MLGFIVTHLGWKLPEAVLPIALAFIIGGIAILLIEATSRANRLQQRDLEGGDLRRPVPDPGGGLPGHLALGGDDLRRHAGRSDARPAATEFAFLVGIPTMFAATAYEFLKVRGHSAGEDWNAARCRLRGLRRRGLHCRKWLLRYVQTHRFTLFAWYRIVLGAALLVAIGTV